MRIATVMPIFEVAEKKKLKRFRGMELGTISPTRAARERTRCPILAR